MGRQIVRSMRFTWIRIQVNPSQYFLINKKIGGTASFVSSIINRFEVYNGAGDNVLLPGIADMGACANVVVRLSSGRPSTLATGRSTPTTTAEARNSPVSLMGKRAKHLPDEVRYDAEDHWPEVGKKMRCKQCKTSQTTFACSKCKLNLCLTGPKNCFKAYHGVF